MKRMISFMLSFAMLFQLTACGGGTPSAAKPETENQPQAAPAAESPENFENIPVTEQENGDIIPATDDFYASQQTVFAQLNEKSIGANKDLIATLKTAPTVQYTLDEKDYNYTFELRVNDTDSWTPFVSGKETSFEVSDENLIDYQIKNKKNFSFTAREAGECVVTAAQNGKTSTALIRILPVEDDRSTSNSVEYYMLYLANELAPLESEEKADYLISLGDYAANLLASGQVDGNLVNAMAAACMIYPNTYLINNYAALLMERGQYKEALVWLEQADEANPHNVFILTNMGECHYELGNFSKALAYTDKAISCQEDYGIPHLIQACIYAQQGTFEQFITSLFKSARASWTDVHTKLFRKALTYVTEYVDRYDKMPVTKEHLDILMEAASYGTTSDGRDKLSEQISLPFPAPVTSACLTAEKSYSDQASALYDQVKALYYDARYYEGYANGKDDRHHFIARFHILYYEWMIEENDASDAMFGEEYDRLEAQFYEKANSIIEPAEEKIAELQAELYEAAMTAVMGMMLTPFADDPDAVWSIAQQNGKFVEEYWEPYQTEMTKITLDAYTEVQNIWHTDLKKMEEAKMDGYETITRPILEEYWQRMNAILGYMTNDTQRKNFEKRVLWTINTEGITVPLGYAGVELREVNKYAGTINGCREKLQMAEIKRIEAANQQAQANVQQAKLEKAKAEQQQRSSSYQLGFPPFSPIQVYIGYTEDGNISYGYGAFGHDVIYEHDFKTGNTSKNVASTTLAGLPGLGQLDKTVAGLKDLYDTIENLRDIEGALVTLENVVGMAKGQIVAGLPSVDARETTGSIEVYNSDGELIDRSTYRTTSVSGGGGLLGSTVETTTTKSQYKNPLNGKVSNVVRTQSKGKITVGGFTFEENISGVLPGH